MSVNQISVFLENKPGTLNAMTGVLRDGGINIRAMTVSETKDFGIARIIVNDTYQATTTLKEAGFVCSLTPVVVCKASDVPGGLNGILKIMSENGINIEYMYASISAKDVKDACFVFRVTDTKGAVSTLNASKIHVVMEDEL